MQPLDIFLTFGKFYAISIPFEDSRAMIQIFMLIATNQFNDPRLPVWSPSQQKGHLSHVRRLINVKIALQTEKGLYSVKITPLKW